MHNLKTNEWNQEKTERVVINLCFDANKFGSRLTLDDFNSDNNGSFIPDLNDDTAKTVMDSLKKKISAGLESTWVARRFSVPSTTRNFSILVPSGYEPNQNGAAKSSSSV